MPNAQFEVIDQAGHFLPEDAPERLAQFIIDTKFSVHTTGANGGGALASSFIEEASENP